MSLLICIRARQIKQPKVSRYLTVATKDTLGSKVGTLDYFIAANLQESPVSRHVRDTTVVQDY